MHVRVLVSSHIAHQIQFGWLKIAFGTVYYIISYHFNASWIVSCRVMSWRLYCLRAQSTCTDVTHFYQFSPPYCNLITLANFHATHHIWLERFIAIVHPVNCCGFIAHTHSLITHLRLLFFSCCSAGFTFEIEDICIMQSLVHIATDAISIWLSLYMCNANDIIWLSSFHSKLKLNEHLRCSKWKRWEKVAEDRKKC